MEQHLESLKRILAGIGPCVVAFSGGVDSTFLLKVARDVLGDDVLAVTAVSPTLADGERLEAVGLARLIGAPHRLVESHELDDPRYLRNDARRCYFCRAELFGILDRVARAAGRRAVIYGAIVDDLGDDRPGMQAAAGAGVRAPLVEAGLTKEMIRVLSKRLGLPTWDKPAMACLASRIPRFTPVTAAALALVERAEANVHGLGYRQVRVRLQGPMAARVEVDPADLDRALAPEGRRRIVEAVRAAGVAEVSVDPRGYRPGGAGMPAPARPA